MFASNFGPLKNLHCSKLDRGLPALLDDMDQPGMWKETIVVAVGEFGATRAWAFLHRGIPIRRMAGITGRIAISAHRRGSGYRACQGSTGSPMPRPSSSKEKPVHPNDLLAKVYYAPGIDPDKRSAITSTNTPRSPPSERDRHRHLAA